MLFDIPRNTLWGTVKTAEIQTREIRLIEVLELEMRLKKAKESKEVIISVKGRIFSLFLVFEEIRCQDIS